MSLSFSERESGKLSLGLSDFYHDYLTSNDCIQHSGKISIYKPNKNNFLYSNMAFCPVSIQ